MLTISSKSPKGIIYRSQRRLEHRNDEDIDRKCPKMLSAIKYFFTDRNIDYHAKSKTDQAHKNIHSSYRIINTIIFYSYLLKGIVNPSLFLFKFIILEVFHLRHKYSSQYPAVLCFDFYSSLSIWYRMIFIDKIRDNQNEYEDAQNPDGIENMKL